MSSHVYQDGNEMRIIKSSQSTQDGNETRGIQSSQATIFSRGALLSILLTIPAITCDYMTQNLLVISEKKYLDDLGQKSLKKLRFHFREKSKPMKETNKRLYPNIVLPFRVLIRSSALGLWLRGSSLQSPIEQEKSPVVPSYRDHVQRLVFKGTFNLLHENEKHRGR